VNVGTLAARNVLRNKVRTSLTVLGVAVAIVAFCALRTFISAWGAAGKYAAKDRLAVRNKVSFVVTIPKTYVEEISHIDGVASVSWSNWFGGKSTDPAHKNDFFATLAVDPESYVKAYDEVEIPEDQKNAWIADKSGGAMIGDQLAKKMGWKVGQDVTIQSSIFPRSGDWHFTIDAIYTSKSKGIDRTGFFFHWDYLDNFLPDGPRKNQVGWVVVRVKDPKAGAAVGDAIDKHFAGRDIETLTQSEREMQLSFMAIFSAVLSAISVVSFVIMLIMMLILGNTIAMGVRERTNEYGVLRAIGFLPKHVAAFIIGEGLTIGVLGAALGFLIAIPFTQGVLGRFLAENMGNSFPEFKITPETYGLGLGLALGLALIASALPARAAAKVSVIDSLRRVG
jgi:putative ABC transport system permease protein